MGKNRHLAGDTNPMLVDVADCIHVDQGDLMVLAVETAAITRTIQRLAGSAITTKSGGTGFAYPMQVGATTVNATNVAYKAFIGVAESNSPKGSTDTIAVARTGIFRFPVAGAVGGVTVGQLAQHSIPVAVTDFNSGSTINYYVRTASIRGGGGASGCSIGWVVKTEAGSPANVDVEIRSAFSGGGSIVDG